MTSIAWAAGGSRAGRRTFRRAAHPSRSSWRATSDRVVVLSREKIEAALGTGRETTFEVRLTTELVDKNVNGGDCSLFLKIERLP